MIFENIFVVAACMNDGKNLDYPFDSKPIVTNLKAIRAEVTILMAIHHTIPSKALSPKIPAAIPMKILAQTLV